MSDEEYNYPSDEDDYVSEDAEKPLEPAVVVAKEPEKSTRSRLKKLPESFAKSYEAMPPSAERVLHAVVMETHAFLDANADSERLDGVAETGAKIEAHCEELRRRLVDEGLLDELSGSDVKNGFQRLQQAVSKARSSGSFYDWLSLIELARGLIKLLRPLDLEEIFRLIDETKKGADIIRDQEIILLLGKTGAGKSTTAHFLAGTRLSQGVNNQFNVDEKALDGMDESLRRITISASANSETRFLSPVLLDLRTLISKSKTVYACDTPGFDDTAGVEVDIANAFGLVEAVQKSRSVRPVAVLNYDGVGGRLEGVIDLAHLLNRMFKDLENVIDTFTFVYTKCPPGFRAADMLEQAYEREGLAENIKNLLLDMINKSKRDANIIDPLDLEAAKALLKRLVALNPINHPKEEFKNFLTENSINQLKLQFSAHERSILSALKRVDFDLVAFKLGQLRRLREYLATITWLGDDYRSIVRQIGTVFDQLYQESLGIFAKQLENRNRITQANVEAYKRAMETFRKVKVVVEDHFETDKQIDYEKYLNDHVVSVAEKICSRIREHSFEDDDHLSALDNVHLLVDHFGELVQPVYSKLRADLTAKFDRLSAGFRAREDPFQLDAIAAELRTLKRLDENIRVCLSRENEALAEQVDYRACVRHVIESIRAQVSELLGRQEKGDLAAYYGQVKAYFGKLSDAIAHTDFSAFVSASELKEIRKSTEGELTKSLNELARQAEAILKREPDKDTLQLVRPLIREMQLVREIDAEVALATHKTYHECVGAVEHFVSGLNAEVAGLFERLKSGRADESVDRIRLFFDLMSDAEWLNELRPGLCSSAVRNYERDLVRQATQLAESLQELAVDVRDHINVEQAFGLYTQLSTLRPLGERNERMREVVSGAEKHFRDQIEQAFASMRDAFDLERLTLAAQTSELEKLTGKELERQQALVEHMTEWNQTHHFGKLDAGFCQAAMQWLRVMKTTRSRLFQAQVAQAEAACSTYLHLYFKYVEAEFSACLDAIGGRGLSANASSAPADADGRLKACVQRMIGLLRDCKLVQSQNELVYAELKSENDVALVDYLNELLEAYALSLDEKMQQAKQNGANPTLNGLLASAQLLAYLDTHMRRGESRNQMAKPFAKIYEEYSNQNLTDSMASIGKIEDYLAGHNYRGIALELTRIEGLRISASALKQMRHAVSMSVQNLMDAAYSLERRVTRDFRLEPIEELAKTLKALNMADGELFSLLERSSEQDTTTTAAATVAVDSNVAQVLSREVKEQISETLRVMAQRLCKKLDAFLDSIDAYIRANDFQPAETSRDKYEQVYSCLSDYLVGGETHETPDETQEATSLEAKFERIEKAFEDDLKKTVLEYASMPITDYQVRWPKSLLEKLEKAAAKGEYREAADKISDSIVRNVRAFMRSHEQKPPKSDATETALSAVERFDLVENMLWYLPKRLELQLQTELEKIRQEYNRSEERRKQEIRAWLERNDVERLAAVLDNEKVSDDVKYHAQTEITRHVQETEARVRRALDDSEAAGVGFDKVLVDCRLVGQYCERFQARVKELERSLKSVKAALARHAETICLELARIARTDAARAHELERRFDELQALVELARLSGGLVDAETAEKLREQAVQMLAFFATNVELFSGALKALNAELAEEAFRRSLVWSGLFKKLKTAPLSAVDQERSEALGHGQLVRALLAKLNELRGQTEELRMDDTAAFKYEDRRLEVYTSLAERFLFLRALLGLSDHVKTTQISMKTALDEIQTSLQTKADGIKASLEQLVARPRLTTEDFASLRFLFENVVSIAKCFAKVCPVSVEQIKDTLIGKCQAIVEEAAKKHADLKEFAKCLVALKRFADYLPSLKEKIHSIIGEALADFKKRTSSRKLVELSGELESDEIGAAVVSEFDVFQGEIVRSLYEKTNRHGIGYVLERLDGDALDQERLNDRYKEYEAKYVELVKRHLTSKSLDGLKEELTGLLGSLDTLTVPEKLRRKTPELVAHVAALWTLLHKKFYEEVDDVRARDSYLLRPHAAQIIAVFRLLGTGYEASGRNKFTLANNLVQVGTGEGKSVILALTAAILALLKFDVSCACYSEYLSRRDYAAFQGIFDLLDVASHIHYGTFNAICERILNDKFDIRDKVVGLIKSGGAAQNKDAGQIVTTTTLERPKVLLIDEVDVFFSRDFLGKLYVPSARLADPAVSALLDLIWRLRLDTDGLSLAKVQASAEFAECQRRFPDWIDLVSEAVKDAIADLRGLKTHDYVVSEDKIAYQEHDGLNYNTVYGYKTLWAYYQENEKGAVSKKSLDENKSLGIYTGCFSFSEIPASFEHIFGVSGTLKTLNETQRLIIRTNYGIDRRTYMPSVYGDNKCRFAREADTLIHSKDDFNIRLKEEIDRRMLGTKSAEAKRAVLVFFENKKALVDFYESEQIRSVKASVNIIWEETTPRDKETFIREAAKSGQVTFLTRSFGRGIDFICRNQTLLANGGVHVIQTFLSEDLSEEVQIRGRTARQGEEGSYSMALVDQEQELFLGSDYKARIEAMRNQNRVYETLNEARNAFFTEANKANITAIEDVRKDHETSKRFLDSLAADRFDDIKRFLLDNNRGAVLSVEKSRTICIMDATGSMTHLLTNAKNTVSTMFERIRAILAAKSLAEDSFELEFAVYRDYDNHELVLQASGWHSNPLNLRQFMDTIAPLGNSTGHEAVEIGLWYVNQQSSSTATAIKNKISQALLIGDAPAKELAQIRRDRARFRGENYWRGSRFGEATFWEWEVEKIAQAKIPVHTFYVDTWCRQNFGEIARRTGGSCSPLDVNSPDGAQRLTDVVSLIVLQDIGERNGGLDLVGEYNRKFPKSYK